MTAAKRQRKQARLFWRVVISAVGAGLILLTVLRLSLFFFGETAVADISVRRLGGANDGAPANQRYQWAVSYSFADRTGKERSGYAVYRGSDHAVNVGSRVCYFAAAPFLHALEKDTEPGLGQLVILALGVLLIVVMNRKKPAKEKKPAPKKPVTIDSITDYDDSIEEYYHDDTN